LEKSSTSLTRSISTSALCRCTSARLARRASGRVGRRSISVAPIIPWSGVRISWLTWVTKRALAAVAANAASRASSSARRSSLLQWEPSAANRETNTADRLIDMAQLQRRVGGEQRDRADRARPQAIEQRGLRHEQDRKHGARASIRPAMSAPIVGTPSHQSAGEWIPSWNSVTKAIIANRSTPMMSIARQ
jgi:hypothetical protein